MSCLASRDSRMLNAASDHDGMDDVVGGKAGVRGGKTRDGAEIFPPSEGLG